MKGFVAARTVTCKACGTEFISVSVGKAAWYCDREDCREARKKNRKPRPKKPKQLPQPSPKKPQLKKKAKPERELTDIERMEKVAATVTPSKTEFRKAMKTVILSESSTAKANAYLYMAGIALAASRRYARLAKGEREVVLEKRSTANGKARIQSGPGLPVPQEHSAVHSSSIE